MNNGFWTFFLPQLDGTAFATLQLLFALLFLAAVILLPVLLAAQARPAQWDARLAALDAAGYHTPEELGQAVATAPERWADVLPSLLLVCGLLGTFIGIGLALSDVAGALNGGNVTPLMDALGTKFKISTWGILAFLLLRLWSLIVPHEAARQAWSARVIKARAAQAAEQQAQQAQQDAADRQQLVDAITRSGNALLAAQQAEAQRALVRHADLLDALQRLGGQAAAAREDSIN